MKLSELAVDVERAENGAWVDDIPDLEKLRLKVRGSNNADWRRMQAKLLEAVPRKKRLGGRIDPDDMERIINSCLLNCCLLDWEGLEEPDGKPIPFSKQMASKLIMEPEYRRFRDAVIYAANLIAETNEEDQEEVAGNLLQLSAGSGSGEPKLKAG